MSKKSVRLRTIPRSPRSLNQRKIYPQITQISLKEGKVPLHSEKEICVICVTNQYLFLFLARFLVQKGQKLMAVGERLCAKPTGNRSERLKTLQGSDPEPGSTPFRVGWCERLVRGLRAKPRAHGY